MALPTGTAGVFDPVNVTGILLAKTDTRTPLFNRLGGSVIGSREFVTGAEYAIDASASQPAISETASLTAPTPTFTERTNAKNVTQIFDRSVAISYRKMSDGASLTGLHLEGQTNNVPSERAFQVNGRIAEMRNDIEYTILNGVYNLATTPDTIDKTRGLNAAIGTHVIDAGGDELNPDVLLAMAKLMYSASPFGIDGLVAICNAEQIVQLNKIITNEGQRAGMSEAGSNLLTYLTPFGRLNFLEGGHRYQTNGVVTFANLGICKNVFNTVEGKGNFFYESLAKTGAAETGHIFGQWGLDHGHEWMHGKITGLATSTTAGTAPKVFIANTDAAPIYTSAIS